LKVLGRVELEFAEEFAVGGEELGPSLRWATATPARATKSGAR
jgi:hypothetical protein